MTYGSRLDKALTYAGKKRRPLAEALDVTPQAIGMVINGPGKLSYENNIKAARFLRVSEDWLNTGEGDMLEVKPIQVQHVGPSHMAQELAVVFDMIPPSETFKRAKAFSLATAAIAATLQDVDVVLAPAPDQKRK